MRFAEHVPLQKAIDNILLNVRSSPNDVTGETPFYRFYGREMHIKLTKIAMTPTQLVCRPRNVAREYAAQWSIMKHYEPGQSVLVRKQTRQPYAHEGVVIRKVGKHTYEIKMDGKLCRYN